MQTDWLTRRLVDQHNEQNLMQTHQTHRQDGWEGNMCIGKMTSRQTEKQAETMKYRQANQWTDGCKTDMTDGRWMGGRADGRTDGRTDG